MNKGDLIRQLSNEELSTYLSNFICACPPFPRLCRVNNTTNIVLCKKCWIEFLNSEVDE